MTYKENLYTLTTSKKLEKKLHHRMVPLMLFDPESGKEAVAPMLLGTGSEMVEAESYAENKVKELIGHVEEHNRGEGSTWHKMMDHFRVAKIVEICVRVPTDLSLKLFDLGVDQVLDTYSEHQLGVLKDHYQVVVFSQPDLILLDPEIEDGTLRMQAAIQKIKEMGEDGDFFINGLTTHSVKQLIKYLVSQPPNSAEHTGSSGTPLSNGSEIKNTPME